jgi:hypothetical protein
LFHPGSLDDNPNRMGPTPEVRMVRRTRLTRRALAAGLGGAALAATTAPTPASTAPTPAAPAGLPVLPVSADWATALAATPRVQLVPGATYRLAAPVELPDGCRLYGNGATVTVAGDRVAALRATGRSDLALTDLTFRGRDADPTGTGPVFDHVALQLTRCSQVRVTGCTFDSWRGAGIVVTGSTSDDYFGYRIRLSDNTFRRCYFGVSTTDRGEYGILTGSTFAGCRLAVWNSAGNWSITENILVGCYGGYYSIAATSPYGAQTSDNWGHGSVVGNTVNHSNGGAPGRWSGGAAFPIGGVPVDPGPGVVVRGLLPPTFVGNTLWYSDIRAADLAGTRWLLSGNTLSNLTVSCTGAVPVQLVGTQANGPANLPTLTGNVADLLPASAS